MKNILLLSLGGSLVVPNGIDIKFLRRFVKFVNRNLANWRFIIVVGGGRTARFYTAAASKLGRKNQQDLDWVGIYASRLNAQLVKTLFGRKAYEKVFYNLKNRTRFQVPILVAAGYRPGWSTDYVAARLAELYRVKKIINLTDLYFVFDRDPKKYKKAKIIKKIGWKNFKKIVGASWTPGLSKPFDPIASKFAYKKKFKVIITNGRDFGNLQNLIDGKKFKGTLIE